MSFDLNGWGAELRHALRTLRRTPGFTATVVGTLGLAIGAIAGVFTVLDRVLLAPLPYAPPGTARVHRRQAPGSEMTGRVRRRAASSSSSTRKPRACSRTSPTYNTFTNTLRVGDRVERIRMGVGHATRCTRRSARSPRSAGCRCRRTRTRVVVISDALWRSWFGADPVRRRARLRRRRRRAGPSSA